MDSDWHGSDKPSRLTGQGLKGMGMGIHKITWAKPVPKPQVVKGLGYKYKGQPHNLIMFTPAATLNVLPHVHNVTDFLKIWSTHALVIDTWSSSRFIKDIDFHNVLGGENESFVTSRL